MAAIQKTNGYVVLYDDQNKVVDSAKIPASGKTLQIEVRLFNIAKSLGLKLR